jgi:tetratricopeptide (TPR) repeat protein
VEPAFKLETLHTAAHVYNLAGRHEDALYLCREGLGLARDLGVQFVTADWLGISGDAYYGLGRYSEAAESLRSALPVYRDHFMRRHYGLCLLKIGHAHQAMGEYQAAIDHLTESLGIFDGLQLEHYAERAREALISCHSHQRTTCDQPPEA